MDISTIDLFRIRRSQAETLSRWLSNETALLEFQDAILARLKNYSLLKTDMISPIYLFGREMRQVFDKRSNQDLQFRIRPDSLEDRAYLVFLAGFFRKTVKFASEIVSMPRSKLDNIVDLILAPDL